MKPYIEVLRLAMLFATWTVESVLRPFRNHARLCGLGVICTLPLICGCGDSSDNSDQDEASQAKEETSESDKSRLPSTPAIPAPKTAICRVYTPQPGFEVFVGGQRVVNDAGEPVMTPCAITVPHGEFEIRVAREGYSDAMQLVVVPDVEEVDLEPAEVETPDPLSILQSPRFRAEVGQPIALDELNTAGAELDPYLTADGLQLWFVGDRAEGRGLFVSHRLTPFDTFAPPEFIEASRSRELPATPSFSGDRLMVVYAIPEDARIWALVRSNPFEDFIDRKPLKFASETGIRWPSSQITADGTRLYWVDVQDGKRRSRAAVRKSPDEEFGKALSFELAGTHPCMTPDGLRQFAFDGHALRRSWRPNLQSYFSESEVVTTLELPNYVPTDSRRQYFVSADEQWMIYCQNPERDADLYLVRLSAGPSFGFAVTGKPIAARPVEVVETTAPKQPDPQPPEPEPEPVQVYTYAEFRTVWLDLLRQRQYTAALEMLDQHEADFAGTAFTELAVWDRSDLAKLLRFEQQVQQALNKLQPGDEIRMGAVKLNFVGFDGETVTGERNGTTVERGLSELSAADLVILVDQVVERTDPEAQTRIGMFLFFDDTGNKRTASSRLRRGGDLGSQFLEQHATRGLTLARENLKSGDLAAGRTELLRVIDEFQTTAAAQEAERLNGELYSYVVWDRRGSRDWDADPKAGAYAADSQRQTGAMLISQRPLENFLLEFEWKVQGRTGQGGVFFRYSGEGNPYENGLKIQLANDAGVAPDPLCTGALFKQEAPQSNAARAEGEWNTFAMKVDQGQIEVTINDMQVLDTTFSSSTVGDTGFVGLDGEIGGVAYRKVLLMELPASEKPAENQPQLAPE